MGTGLVYGDEKASSQKIRTPISLFLRDEGGYTTVALAVALLVSLTLVFGTAAASWSAARAADVQEVADAAAMAGSNVVAGFATIAQVTDACVLSMGLAGLATMGVGLVLSAIPFSRTAAPALLDAGKQLLEMRQKFAQSAAEGMQRLEAALPALIMVNAASCVAANSTETISYTGTAIPFPLTSQTDYSFLKDNLTGDDLEKNAEELQEATERKEEAIERANEAKERAWRADCVDDPLCLRSRAQTLAGLSARLNPSYDSPVTWRFEYARRRSLTYYRARKASEHTHGTSVAEMTRSAARRRFYAYAAAQLSRSVCREEGDIPVITLPELPHNTATVRTTTLYTDRVWPCTEEEAGRTLHCSRSCPGATGSSAGKASLADIDSGAVRRCPVCDMDVAAQGSVANASTNISNGYEHYWRIVVEASHDYVKAKQDEAVAEEHLREIADEGEDLFQRAMDMLAVPRPAFIPPGAWGCVAAVRRGEGVISPSELTSAFSSGVTLPAGMAISAATLAPEASTDGSTVLSQVFSGIQARTDFGLIGVVDGVCSLWGTLLVDYGSAYGTMSSHVNGFLDGMGSVFGEESASWLKGRISSIVEAAGLQPADMRVRKPVLVHSQRVLDKAGEGREALGVAREIVQRLPSDGVGAVKVLAQEVSKQLGGPVFTVAEIDIPGTDIKIPLTIDISTYLGSS